MKNLSLFKDVMRARHDSVLGKLVAVNLPSRGNSHYFRVYYISLGEYHDITRLLAEFTGSKYRRDHGILVLTGCGFDVFLDFIEQLNGTIDECFEKKIADVSMYVNKYNPDSKHFSEKYFSL